MTTPSLDTAAIRARLEAATPGPWIRDDGVIEASGGRVIGYTYDDALHVNGDLIADAPTDIASLLAALETAQAGADPTPRDENAEMTPGQWIHAFLERDAAGRLEWAERVVSNASELAHLFVRNVSAERVKELEDRLNHAYLQRDGWQVRAKRAEGAVQRVEELHAREVGRHGGLEIDVWVNAQQLREALRGGGSDA